MVSLRGKALQTGVSMHQILQRRKTSPTNLNLYGRGGRRCALHTTMADMEERCRCQQFGTDKKNSTGGTRG
jgi:hypothetical protein